MQFDSDFSELLTIKEAAKLINVHPNTLRNWEREGKIQAVRIGTRRDRRYSKSEIWQLCHVSALPASSPAVMPQAHMPQTHIPQTHLAV